MILQAYAARPQIFLREVRDVLGESGATASLSGLHRFFARHGISRKTYGPPRRQVTSRVQLDLSAQTYPAFR